MSIKSLTYNPSMLTPPVSWTSTVWPGFKVFGPYRAFELVRAVQVRVLFSRGVRFSAAFMKPFSLKTPYSRKAPSITPPRRVFVAGMSIVLVSLVEECCHLIAYAFLEFGDLGTDLDNLAGSVGRGDDGELGRERILALLRGR